MGGLMVALLRAATDESLFPGIWSLSPLGALIGAVVLIYWLLASGRLIPRGTHEAIVGQERRRGDEWKETAHELRDANAKIRDQNGTLIESARIASDFFAKISPSDIEDTGRHHVGP